MGAGVAVGGGTMVFGFGDDFAAGVGVGLEISPKSISTSAKTRGDPRRQTASHSPHGAETQNGHEKVRFKSYPLELIEVYQALEISSKLSPIDLTIFFRWSRVKAVEKNQDSNWDGGK